MTVGLLIVTHESIGTSLLESALAITGSSPLPVKTLSVSSSSDPERLRLDATSLSSELDDGEGVLVLTDMYGSTPSNIATSLYQKGRVAVIAGINLPMLLKVFNYAGLDLEGIKQKALAGARACIIDCS